MESSKDYIPQLQELASNTDLVHSDDLYNQITASYAYWNSVLAKLTVEKVKWQKEKNVKDENGKMPSIASLEKMWDSTDSGQNLIKIKAEVENLKALAKSVDNHNFTLRAESKLSH